MNESSQWPVWQPLTFSGVAAFARAPRGRLLLLQSLVAAFNVAMVVLLLLRGWFPVVNKAVQGLGDFGALRNARLAWPKTEAVVLAENRFLGLAVDLSESGATGQIADVQVEFGRERVKFVAVLGYTALPYPDGVALELSRPVLDPWWNAWRPAFLFGGGLATALGLFASWLVLATLYALPVRVLAWMGGRAATLAGSWRIAAAALLPGAVWLGVALLLYVLEQLSLVGLGVAFGLHIIVNWVYVAGAPFALPRRAPDALAGGANPFTPSAPAAPTDAPATPPAASENPFHTPSQ